MIMDDEEKDMEISEDEEKDMEIPVDEEKEIPVEENSVEPEEEKKLNPVGRPPGIPASLSQKLAVSKAAKEYQRKLKEGLIEKDVWETHGAYSFMKSGKINKKKKHLVKFVFEERQKWLEALGGEEDLSSIEISMLDEACRLLLFSTMINDHLLTNKKNDILYTDASGDVKMHSALSRNYLSFTKTYVSILKELQKISGSNFGGKKSVKKDSASRIQSLYTRDTKDEKN